MKNDTVRLFILVEWYQWDSFFFANEKVKSELFAF